MKFAVIYRAINTANGKSYIGFTTRWPSRKLEHLSYSKNDVYGSDCVFYNALRKYGEDNFIWEIVYLSFDIQHTLNVMEEYFIRKFKSYRDYLGYNMTYGGQGPVGCIRSLDTRNKMSISRRKRPGSGYVASSETKEKFRILHTGKIQSADHIAKKVLSVQRHWNVLKNDVKISILNMAQYCRDNDLSRGAMSEVCNGKRRTYKGYMAVVA